MRFVPLFCSAKAVNYCAVDFCPALRGRALAFLVSRRTAGSQAAERKTTTLLAARMPIANRARQGPHRLRLRFAAPGHIRPLLGLAGAFPERRRETGNELWKGMAARCLSYKIAAARLMD